MSAVNGVPGLGSGVPVVEIDYYGKRDIIVQDVHAHSLALVAVQVHVQLRRVGAEDREQAGDLRPFPGRFRLSHRVPQRTV